MQYSRFLSIYLVIVLLMCRDLAVELPFMLTHPKPEESEPPPTSSRENDAQDGTGKVLLAKYTAIAIGRLK